MHKVSVVVVALDYLVTSRRGFSGGSSSSVASPLTSTGPHEAALRALGFCPATALPGRGVADADLRDRFRLLIKTVHPDVAPATSSSPSSNTQTVAIIDAYKRLRALPANRRAFEPPQPAAPTASAGSVGSRYSWGSGSLSSSPRDASGPDKRRTHQQTPPPPLWEYSPASTGAGPGRNPHWMGRPSRLVEDPSGMFSWRVPTTDPTAAGSSFSGSGSPFFNGGGRKRGGAFHQQDGPMARPAPGGMGMDSTATMRRGATGAASKEDGAVRMILLVSLSLSVVAAFFVTWAGLLATTRGRSHRNDDGWEDE